MNKHILIPELGFQMEFIYVKPGTFMMGSPETEINHALDQTLHEVTISKPFYLGKYPVTQTQYKVLSKKNPSWFENKNYPVENISWHDSIKFCNKLKKVTEFNFCLPTEAQWEYACRAGTTTSFSFGNELNGTQANCNGFFPYRTSNIGPYLANPSPVGSYPANAWGLHDMHGNVWEWCSDWYSSYGNEKVTDPQGGQVGIARVLKGGSWHTSATNCRSAMRYSSDPNFQNRFIGFRVCLNFT